MRKNSYSSAFANQKSRRYRLLNTLKLPDLSSSLLLLMVVIFLPCSIDSFQLLGWWFNQSNTSTSIQSLPSSSILTTTLATTNISSKREIPQASDKWSVPIAKQQSRRLNVNSSNQTSKKVRNNHRTESPNRWNKVSNKSSSSFDKPFEVIIQNDKTMAHLIFDLNGRDLTYCSLFDLEKESIKLPVLIKPPLSVDYQTMLEAVRRCTLLAEITLKLNTTTFDQNKLNQNQKEKKNSTSIDLSSSSITINNTENHRSLLIDQNTIGTFWRGILPGTKWCGLGDMAERYEDLGSKLDIDVCCRAHDHCPVRLRAFRVSYGVFNFSFYSKSHCECDRDFYKCLKKSPNNYANMLGQFYFNVLKISCLKDETPLPKVCKKPKRASSSTTTTNTAKRSRPTNSDMNCITEQAAQQSKDIKMKVVPFGLQF